MGKVRFLFASSDMRLIDSLQTYSCDFGCNMIFSQYHQLRKHKVMHQDAERYCYLDNMTVSNLTTINRSLYWERPECNFYTLDPRNLEVHFANTGILNSLPFGSGMIHGCPDTIKVHGPSELLNLDCPYGMYDRSLVRKHQAIGRRYIPYPRASSKDAGTSGFVFSSTRSSRAVTSNATSGRLLPLCLSKVAANDSKLRYVWEVSKPSPNTYSTSYAEYTALDGSLPSPSL